jgi:hypothetical protein
LTKTKWFIDALAVGNLPEATGIWERDKELFSGAAPWKEALEALTQDADAPLPAL